MPAEPTRKKLNLKDCEALERCANEKISLYYKQSDILGDQIFDILRQNCRVLFYPLDDEDVWGFYEKIEGKSFICINTSIAYDKQVFVAAHELYHLWYNHPEELILASDIEEREQDLSLEELKANRFAAVLLVPELLLARELKANKMGARKTTIQDIIRLSRIFLVPYRTMVKRLYEIGHISESQCDSFLEMSEEQIGIWRKRLGLELVKRTNDISLDVLIDKALLAYEKRLITREKLDYLLSLAKTTPEELGIPREQDYVPPSDEELSTIMEE